MMARPRKTSPASLPHFAKISVNTATAAEMCGCPKQTLLDRALAGEIPHAIVSDPTTRKHRKCRVFLVEDLRAWVLSRRVDFNGGSG